MTKIIADSSCDMLSNQEISFEAVPLTIYTEQVSYTDDESMNIHEMLDVLEEYKGRSYTACPSLDGWMKAFEGADEVYVLTLTSGMSGTYNSAVVAREQYLEKHPDVKIAVFDTLSTGPELRLMVEKIMRLVDKGNSFEQVTEKMQSYMKKTRLFFSFVSLHNFAQNGRISKVIASTIGMLGISIIGTASEEGTIAPIAKCRGERKVIAKLVDELVTAGYKGGRLRICHIENLQLAERVLEAVKEKFANVDALIYEARGLCSYYGERGGIIIGCETL